jgi:hypothetical protein
MKNRTSTASSSSLFRSIQDCILSFHILIKVAFHIDTPTNQLAMADVPIHKDCRQAKVRGTDPKNTVGASEDKGDQGDVTLPVYFV